eukprot:TRINITY_DN1320_c0_g1::TRINITY_DN1320_c0_g1_i1::g.20055::m.20055 TRINITY_DN1320_c0_g1::TRINITY_DN1320_c0_g1_i1::g.20055  ORF type:complete len:425 (+),score=51.43,Sulfotransfer_3/PF13469.1/3.9e-10,Sulfotransfer_1/PF00685.22/5.3e+03,Sulfotransfer_1/PF00685.22/0.075 TRINITY_DN1320_c0_g1_i1:73-1347(+)
MQWRVILLILCLVVITQFSALINHQSRLHDSDRLSTARALTAIKTPEKQYLFVGGAHGSGTSLIHFVLAEHPLVYGFENTTNKMDEGQHLQDVMPPGYKCAHNIAKVPLLGFGLDGCHLTDSASIATNLKKKRLDLFWNRWWQKTRKVKRTLFAEWLDESQEVYIEKSPPNLVRTRLLKYYYPKAYFVIVIRHPLNILGSSWKRIHTQKGLYDAVSSWIQEYQVARDDLKHIPADRQIFIYYEDFLCNPVARTREIYDLIGIEMPEDMIDHKPNSALCSTLRAPTAMKINSGFPSPSSSSSSSASSEHPLESDPNSTHTIITQNITVSGDQQQHHSRQPLFYYHKVKGQQIVIDAQYMWSNMDTVQSLLKKQNSLALEFKSAIKDLDPILRSEYGYTLQPPYLIPCSIEQRRLFACLSDTSHSP